MTERTKPTYKQLEFARAYVDNQGNGTQAALRVYDTCDPVTAATISSDNLKKPYVQEAIEVFRRETKELADEGLQEAIAHARKELAKSTDQKVTAKARAFLLDAAKLYVSPDSAPKETKHLHLNFPKRD